MKFHGERIDNVNRICINLQLTIETFFCYLQIWIHCNEEILFQYTCYSVVVMFGLSYNAACLFRLRI